MKRALLAIAAVLFTVVAAALVQGFYLVTHCNDLGCH